MQIGRIDHFTLRVSPGRLPALLAFYTNVLGLSEGDRPDFPFAGHWLYADGRPLVHLAGNAPASEAPAAPALSTGKLNHIAFFTTGLQSARERLVAHGLDWQEAPVPGMPLHQIFLQDPAGLKIELTFSAAELLQAGPSTKAAAY